MATNSTSSIDIKVEEDREFEHSDDVLNYFDEFPVLNDSGAVKQNEGFEIPVDSDLLLLEQEEPSSRRRRKSLHQQADVPINPPPSSTTPSRCKRKTKPVPVPLTNEMSEFFAEMDTQIHDAVNECVGILHQDPREYHPFYLRVYKYIVAGQHKGYIHKNPRTAHATWKRYDSFAVAQYQKYLANPDLFSFDGERSPYLIYVLEEKFILNGKVLPDTRNKRDLKKRFSCLEKVVENMKTDKCTQNFREDLKGRLKFFEECKDMTYPGDTIKMNALWKELLEDGTRSSPQKKGLVPEKQQRSRPSRVKKVTVIVKKVPIKSEEISDSSGNELRPSSISKRSRKVIKRKAVLGGEPENVKKSLETDSETSEDTENEEDTTLKPKRKRVYDKEKDRIRARGRYQRRLAKMSEEERTAYREKRNEDRRKSRARRKEKLETLGPDERELSRMAKEKKEPNQYRKKISTMSEEEYKKYRQEITERAKFKRIQKKIEEDGLPEEERKRLETERYLKRMAYLAKIDKETLEDRRKRSNEWHKQHYKTLAVEKKMQYREKRKACMESMDEEGKMRCKRLQYQGMLRYQEKLKKEQPERWKEMCRQSYLKHKQKIFLYYRNRVANENEEQREKRLLGYRINAAKRKAKAEMEQEGNWTKEEMEKRLEAVAEEVRSQPRPVRSSYKPRPEARKPKRKTTQLETTSDAEGGKKGENSGIGGGEEDGSMSSWANSESSWQQGVNNTINSNSESVSQIPVPPNTPTKRKRGRPRVYPPPHTVLSTSPQKQANQINSSVGESLLQVQISNVTSLSKMEVQKNSTVHDSSASQMKSAPQPLSGMIVGGQDSLGVSMAPGLQPAILKSQDHRLQNGYKEVDEGIVKMQDCTDDNFSDHGYDDDDRGGSPIQEAFSDAENGTSRMSNESNNYILGDTEMKPAQTNATMALPLPSFSTLSPEPKEAPILQHVKSAAPPSLPPSGTLSENLVPAKKRFICEECGRGYCSARGVRDHKAKFHNSIGANLKCPECNFVCSGPSSLWQHFSYCHGTSELPLDLEQVDEPPISNSQTPQPQPEIVPLVSIPVKKRRPPRSVKDGKYNRGTDEPNICDECGKSFRQTATLYDHIRQVHQGQIHQCPECGNKQQTAAKLWRHRVERHNLKGLPPPPGAKMIICEFCSELVMRGYRQHVLKNHPEHAHKFTYERVIDEKTGEERVKCPQCPTLLLNEDIVPRHIRKVHLKRPKPNAKPRIHKGSTLNQIHACAQCSKKFSCKMKMLRHYNECHTFGGLERKLEAKNYIRMTSPIKKSCSAVCLLCNCNLPVRISIRAHFVSEHHQILKDMEVLKLAVFECDICNEKFTNQEHLNKHMKTEHAEKMSACRFCGKLKCTGFKLNIHEEGHRLQMAKDGITACYFCNEQFQEDVGNFGEKLREHVKTIHPEKFFPCQFCSKVLKSEHSRRQHLGTCILNKNRQDEHSLDVVAEIVSLETLGSFIRDKLRKLRVNCSECDKACYFYMLRGHMKKDHEVKEEEILTCEQCGKLCKSMMYYVAHCHLAHQIPLDELIKIENVDEKEKQFGKVKTKIVKSTNRRKRRKKSLDNDDEEEEADNNSDSDSDVEWNGSDEELMEETGNKIKSKSSEVSIRHSSRLAVKARKREGKKKSNKNVHFSNDGRKDTLESKKTLVIKLVRLTESEINKLRSGNCSEVDAEVKIEVE